MNSDEPQTIIDPIWGHHRLDPVPTGDELSNFYQSQYYDLMRNGGRAPDLRRYMEGGKEQESQTEWLTRTLYSLVLESLEAAPGPRVLELGCGVGALVKYLADAGFLATGVEPSPVAVETARALGASVVEGDFRAYRQADPASLDAVVMLNVLEHVPEPTELLEEVRQSLNPDGLVVIRVPNDFSEIQLAAHAKNGGRRWWVASPDHISYFNYTTLPSILERLGFRIIDALGDFPMELFLLMGRDYVNQPEQGRSCHQNRVEFELALPPEQLRAIYRALASCGVGRNMFIVARKAEQDDAARIDMKAVDHRAGGYRFVELRAEDIQRIRVWRNAQQEVLRQKQPLTESGQRHWFQESVMPMHLHHTPRFLLVSILDESDQLVGYGGLTNIDWDHRRAELSFLVDPERSANPASYEQDLLAFWKFASSWAFSELGLHRLFTETYVFREEHIALLERAGMQREGVLKDHIKTENGYVDSLMHGLYSSREEGS